MKQGKSKNWINFYLGMALLIFWVVITSLVMPSLLTKALIVSFIITILLLNRTFSMNSKQSFDE